MLVDTVTDHIQAFRHTPVNGHWTPLHIRCLGQLLTSRLMAIVKRVL